MKLTSDAVEQIMRECLFRDDESRDNAVMVSGIVTNYGFHPGRIQGNTEAISEMLAELPEEFQSNGGGGWSFLNACNDRHGDQWTGLHEVMEHLFVLGIAAGKARWMPAEREVWTAMPGGVPYVQVN